MHYSQEVFRFTEHASATRILRLAMLATIVTFTASGGSRDRKQLLEISGAVSFEAPTNQTVITVEGKSKSLHGRAKVSGGASGLLLETIEAWVPVSSLETGIGLRDQHMRKQVFTSADGGVPDVRFAAKTGRCTGNGKELTCQLSGGLTIRGVTRPFTINLKVNQEAESQPVFRAQGESLVKLSDYGIEPPSRLGVKVANEVKLKLDFTGKYRSQTSPTDGSRG